MNNSEIRAELFRFDRQFRKAVYVKADLRTLFRKNTDAAFNKALRDFVKSGELVRVSHGVYLYAMHTLPSQKIIADVVGAIRRKCVSYLSLESALSEYGIISQIPFRMTFMTTGKSGVFNTPVGVIEFTHTKRNLLQINQDTIHDEYYMKAKPATAYRDLKRVGRNLHLVQQEELEEVLAQKI